MAKQNQIQGSGATGNGKAKREPVSHIAFTIPAGANPAPDRIDADGVMALRGWQARGHEALRGRLHRILLAPTGSGKSTLIKALSAEELATHPRTRVVIAVPQGIIARSFGDARIRFGGRAYGWGAGHRLLDATGSVDALIAFVTGKPSASPEARTLLCTHQTLVMAHQRLMRERHGKRSPWEDVSLYIDEAHHSACSDDRDEKDAKLRNKLGSVVAHWLDEKPGHLLLATATWLRANLDEIVPQGRFEDFTRFVFSVDEYLEGLEHLREIRFRYLLGDPAEAIRAIYAEGSARKTIAYLPNVASRLAREQGDKHAMLASYQAAIGPCEGTDDWTVTLRHTPPSGKPYRVRTLDFVTETGRDERKGALFAAIPRGPKHTPDLLWALNLGREGFDWPELSRAIVIGERGSIPEVLQMLGRLLRDYPGKRVVEFNMVLPYDGDDGAEQLRGYLKTILASLIVEWQLRPRRPIQGSRPTGGGGGGSSGSPSPLDELLDNPEEMVKLVNAIVEAAIREPDKSPDEIIASVLASMGLGGGEAGKKALGSDVKRLFSERTKAMVVDAADLDIDIDVREDAFGCVRLLAARFGYKNLAELRDAIGMRVPPVPVEVLRERIQGMTQAEYNKARVAWGPGFQNSARFRDVYGIPFREIQRGYKYGTVPPAPIEELRPRIQGMTTKEYDAVFQTWGPGYHRSAKFPKYYDGKTFLEVRDGRRRDDYIGREEFIAAIQGMTTEEYRASLPRAGFPQFPRMKPLYGGTFAQLRDQQAERAPDSGVVAWSQFTASERAEGRGR